MSDSPVSVPYSENAVPLSVDNNVTLVAGQRAFVMAGYDGSKTQFLSVDTSGRVWVNVNGSVGVSGTVTANIGTTGGLALDATLTSGGQRSRITDGTNNVGLTNTAPTGSEYGLVVRNIPSGTQTVTVSNFPVTQPVSGTVAVSNFPATQPVSGTVTANQGTGAGASSAWSVRFSDGTNFYVGPSSSQFPVSLVSGRFDVNVGAAPFFGVIAATAPTSAVLLGGTDGSLLRGLLVDTSGRALVSQSVGAGASAPWSVRLTDGTNFYISTQQSQLPSSLVGGEVRCKYRFVVG